MGEERVASGGEANIAKDIDRAGIEVCLGGGRVIRVGRRFDPATLVRVVAVLEGGVRC